MVVSHLGISVARLTAILALATGLGMTPLPAQPPMQSCDRLAYSEEDTYPTTEALLSSDALSLALADTRHILSTPRHWQRDDWAQAGLQSLGIAAAVHLLDEPVRDAFGGRYENDPGGAAAQVEKLGERRYVWSLLAGFYASGLMRDDDRARAVAIDGVIAIFVADSLITSKLKRAFGRGRPYLGTGADQFAAFDGDAVDRRSFPSGHTTVAFSVASVIASHYQDRPWVPPIAYGTATLVGLARMHHDMHWSSDVLAGALIGTLVGREIVRFNHDRRRERARRDTRLDIVDGQLTLVRNFD
jgi:membrane-associated phospholipid phosphatase